MMMRLAIVFALTAAPSPAAAAKDDMTCEICPMIVDDLDAVSTLLRCFSLFTSLKQNAEHVCFTACDEPAPSRPHQPSHLPTNTQQHHCSAVTTLALSHVSPLPLEQSIRTALPGAKTFEAGIRQRALSGDGRQNKQNSRAEPQSMQHSHAIIIVPIQSSSPSF